MWVLSIPYIGRRGKLCDENPSPAPGWCGLVGWSIFLELKGYMFDSQSVFIPELQVQCLVQAHTQSRTFPGLGDIRGSQSMLFSHIDVYFPFSLPLSLIAMRKC